MPLLKRGRPLKRWRYVAIYRPDVMVCVGDARVGGIPQRWWALALPDGTLLEGDEGILLSPGRVRVQSSMLVVDVSLEENDGIEVVSPSGREWIWTRKQAPVRARGVVTAGPRSWEIDGENGFIDDSAGYHQRHTTWRWSAGLGVGAGGERVAWNLVTGVHDSPESSERTVWVDGEPREVGPVEFADDLSRVGGLRFTPWAAREDHSRRLFFRSDYLQPFGSFEGELPGGPRLASGYGVMEWHDVRW
jgi:hypothetical protein